MALAAALWITVPDSTRATSAERVRGAVVRIIARDAVGAVMTTASGVRIGDGLYTVTARSVTDSAEIFEIFHPGIVLGRSPEEANRVLPSDDVRVLQRRCWVRRDPTTGTVMLCDEGSTYSTYLESGRRIMRGAAHVTRERCRFYLGTPDESLEIDFTHGSPHE